MKGNRIGWHTDLLSKKPLWQSSIEFNERILMSKLHQHIYTYNETTVTEFNCILHLKMIFFVFFWIHCSTCDLFMRSKLIRSIIQKTYDRSRHSNRSSVIRKYLKFSVLRTLWQISYAYEKCLLWGCKSLFSDTFLLLTYRSYWIDTKFDFLKLSEKVFTFDLRKPISFISISPFRIQATLTSTNISVNNNALLIKLRSNILPSVILLIIFNVGCCTFFLLAISDPKYIFLVVLKHVKWKLRVQFECDKLYRT